MLGALLLAAASSVPAYADNSPFGDDAWKRIVRLNGDWKFSVGDSADWATPGFVDQEWATIHAPAEWQSEGYEGYNGYAWYRKTFVFPSGHDRDEVYLSLGRIDDVDQVYLNGKLVGGTGQFPPHYASAYDQARVYEVLPVSSWRDGTTLSLSASTTAVAWAGSSKDVCAFSPPTFPSLMLS